MALPVWAVPSVTGRLVTEYIWAYEEMVSYHLCTVTGDPFHPLEEGVELVAVAVEMPPAGEGESPTIPPPANCSSEGSVRLTARLYLNGREAQWSMTSDAIDGPSIKAEHAWNCTDDRAFLFNIGDSECNSNDGEWPNRLNTSYTSGQWQTSKHDGLAQDNDYWYLFGYSWFNSSYGTTYRWYYPPPFPLEDEITRNNGPYRTYTLRCEEDHEPAACWFPDWFE